MSEGNPPENHPKSAKNPRGAGRPKGGTSYTVEDKIAVLAKVERMVAKGYTFTAACNYLKIRHTTVAKWKVWLEEERAKDPNFGKNRFHSESRKQLKGTSAEALIPQGDHPKPELETTAYIHATSTEMLLDTYRVGASLLERIEGSLIANQIEIEGPDGNKIRALKPKDLDSLAKAFKIATDVLQSTRAKIEETFKFPEQKGEDNPEIREAKRIQQVKQALSNSYSSEGMENDSDDDEDE